MSLYEEDPLKNSAENQRNLNSLSSQRSLNSISENALSRCEHLTTGSLTLEQTNICSEYITDVRN